MRQTEENAACKTYPHATRHAQQQDGEIQWRDKRPRESNAGIEEKGLSNVERLQIVSQSHSGAFRTEGYDSWRKMRY